METIKLNVGKSSTIVLTSLASAGYLWTFQIDNEQIVSVSEDRSPTTSGDVKAGSSFPEKFLVTALKPGTAKLIFVQKRSWEQNKAAISTLIFTVIVS